MIEFESCPETKPLIACTRSEMYKIKMAPEYGAETSESYQKGRPISNLSESGIFFKYFK